MCMRQGWTDSSSPSANTGMPCATKTHMSAHSHEGRMEKPGAHGGIDGVMPPASPQATDAGRLQMTAEKITRQLRGTEGPT
jgi:hypothetical protein